MEFLKENIVWMAPMVAIALVAGVALERIDSGSFLSGDNSQVEETRLAAAQGQAPRANTVAVLNAAPRGSADGQRVQSANASVQTTRSEQAETEVSRSVSVDLLETAPVAEPVMQPTKVDVAEAANFFAVAQANLAEANSCGDDLKALAASARVYFPAGGLTADDSGLATARLIGQVARDCPGFTVKVEGHSDPSGDPVINQRLSKERAMAVISRLSSAGIDTRNFVAVGYGETRPSYTQGPKASAYYDRRVEFSIEQNVQQASLSSPSFPWQAPSVVASNCVKVLENKVAQTRLFYSPRAITVSPGEMEAVQALATETMQCDGARLRLVGHHSDQPGSREDAATGRLRVLALMSSLVSAGFAKEKILIGAPSASIGVKGQPGLPNSRVDFQIIMD